MGKIRTTKNQIVNSYNNIISIGYCNIQNLLCYKNADYCTTGVYGWNADIYKINSNTVICTGYRPFGNINIKYDLEQKFDKKAEKIRGNQALTYEQKIKKIDKLLNDFINEALKQ